jgi:hypothetical protein
VSKNVNPADPVDCVLSKNLHRRHPTPGQRALCAARATALREKLDAEARERQAATRKKGNSPVQANLSERDKGQSRDAAGKLFSVGGRSVDYATKIIKDAVPEVVKAVEEGRMAVSTAAILSSETEEVQRGMFVALLANKKNPARTVAAVTAGWPGGTRRPGFLRELEEGEGAAGEVTVTRNDETATTRNGATVAPLFTASRDRLRHGRRRRKSWPCGQLFR